MSTSSLFLIPLIHTEFLVIFWFFRPRWKPLVDAREGDLRRLLSEVFEWKADYVILTASSEKNFSLIALRKEKNIYQILWKSRFSVETITFLRFFRAAYLRRWPRTAFADQGPSKTVAFFRIPSKIFISGTWNFRIIERSTKAIFREYFSSLREDSGKIFKLMTFRRGPRTTYCILWRGTCTMLGVGIFYYQQVLC